MCQFKYLFIFFGGEGGGFCELFIRETIFGGGFAKTCVGGSFMVLNLVLMLNSSINSAHLIL